MIWAACLAQAPRPHPDWDEDRFGHGLDDADADLSARAASALRRRLVRPAPEPPPRPGRRGRRLAAVPAGRPRRLDRLGSVGAALGRPRDGRVRRPRVPRAGGAAGGDPRRPAAVARPLRAGVALARQADGRALGGRGDRGECRRCARRGGLSRPRGAGRSRLLAAARWHDDGSRTSARALAMRRSRGRRVRSSSGFRRSSATARSSRRAASSSSSPTTLRPSGPRSGRGCALCAGTSCRSSSRIRPGSRASRTCPASSSRLRDPATGAVAPTRFTRAEVRDLALGHERRLDRALRTFRHLGFDPVLVGSEDGFAPLAAWAARRQALRRGAA